MDYHVCTLDERRIMLWNVDRLLYRRFLTRASLLSVERQNNAACSVRNYRHYKKLTLALKIECFRVASFCRFFLFIFCFVLKY